MSESLSLVDAAALTVSQWPNPLILRWDISLLVQQLYHQKHVGDLPLRIKKDLPERSDVSRVIHGLLKKGLIKESKQLPYYGIYAIPKKKLFATEIVCFMDPFAYLSYFSAMAWHSLTTKKPEHIQVSSAKGSQWTNLIRAAQEEKLSRQDWLNKSDNEYFWSHSDNFGWKKFDRLIIGKEVTRYQETGWNPENFQSNISLNVATLGHTYAQMIRKPSRCGGIQNVLSSFEEHGHRHQKTILKEIDTFGTKIDKCRVGYIMEELVNIAKDPILDKWAMTAAQRGGSRKLDSENDYTSRYSERWCLSINI